MSDNPTEMFPTILVVDDDKNVIEAINRNLKLLEIPDEQVLTALSKEEALKYFEHFEKLKDMRHRIHLLFSDVRMPREETGIAFLEQVREMEPHPYTVAISGYRDTENLQRITDDFLEKPEGVLNLEEYKRILADCEAYWATVESVGERTAEKITPQIPPIGHRCVTTGPPAPEALLEEVEEPESEPDQQQIRRYSTMPPPPLDRDRDEESDWIISPFPPLKKFDTHNPLKIQGESLPLALFDLDGTLVRTSTRDVILLSGFVRHLYETNPDFGNKDLWKELMERFEDWLAIELGTKKTDLHGFYEDQIQTTSKIFGLSLAGAEVDKVKRMAREWIEKRLSAEKSPFYDYTRPIIEHTAERGIYPTIVTGTPDFLVQPLADDLGIPFYFGMEFETERRKIGKNGEEFKEFFTGDVRYITGGKEAKKKVCDKLLAKGHVIIFGMGNSDADEPLLKASLASRESHDFYGSSILVNPGKSDSRHFRRYCYSEALSDQITIVRKESEAVVNTFRHKLSDVLANRRNVKKVRDVLLGMEQNTEGDTRKFTLDEVVQRLRDFYGYEAVYNALKVDLRKIHSDYLIHALSEAGVSDETLTEVGEALNHLQETGKPLEKDDEDEEEDI